MNKNAPGNKAPLAQRLDDVRDIFNLRTNFSATKTTESRLSLAEGGCLLPPHIDVQLAMQEALQTPQENPFQIYPFETVNTRFISKVRTFFEERCKIPFNDNTGIILGFGSSHIFDGLLSVICEPGDVILMPLSYYHSFADWPTKWGAHAEYVETKAENGFKLQASELKRWLDAPENADKKVKCLQITNPTTAGAIYSTKELEALAAIIQEYDLLVFADEVFRDTEFADKHPTSLASIPGMQNRVITANSGSKTRGVTDMRLGWACGPSHIADKIIHYMERTVTEIPLYLQHIGCAIIDTPDDYLAEASREYGRRINFLTEEIEQLNRRLQKHFDIYDQDFVTIPYRPETGHYMCINFDGLTDFKTDGGIPLENSVDLGRYLYNPSAEDSPSEGVIFSCGHSKGHDDMTLYIAFAQPGFEAANEIMQDYTSYELFKASILKQSQRDDLTEEDIRAHARMMGLPFADAQMPDLEPAYETGLAMLHESIKRVERAIKTLTPPQHLTSKPHYSTAPAATTVAPRLAAQ